jgi:hypothetical protein
MRSLACFPFSLMVIFLPALSAQTRYSAVDQFSLNSNPNGPWSYIDSTEPLLPLIGGVGILGLIGWISPVVTVTAREGIWKNTTGATLVPPAFTNLVMPPDHLLMGSFGSKLTLRFAAPSAGTYTITGDFLGIDTAQTPHPVSVLINGSATFSGTLANYKQTLPFSLTQPLKAGDLVDFVSTGLGSTDCDAGLMATITSAGPTSISPNGVVSASAFGAFTTVAPASIIEIY